MGKKIKNNLESLLDEISSTEQAQTDAKMILAARIHDAMQAKKWKNKDLLNAVGKKNPSVITKWLSGTHNFTIDTLVELEEALDISLLDHGNAKKEVVVNYHVIVKTKVQSTPFYSNVLGSKNEKFHDTCSKNYFAEIAQS